MLPNLAALRHRAPLANTGPQVPVDKDGETCPISLEDLPRGTPAWQPEVIKGEATHVEKEHFYDIVALAKWLATSPSVTTPLTRGRVTPEDRRDCILAANYILEARNEPLLPVPPPPGEAQAYSTFEARLFETVGRRLLLALEEFYHLPNGRRASAAGLRVWMCNHCRSVQQTYALWWRLVTAHTEALDAPETLWQPGYEPAQDASLVRRAAGRMQTYFSQYVSQLTYARARAAQIDKYRDLTDAVERYAAAVLRPEGIVENSYAAQALAGATRDGHPFSIHAWADLMQLIDPANWQTFQARTTELMQHERRAAIDAWMEANNDDPSSNWDEWVAAG